MELPVELDSCPWLEEANCPQAASDKDRTAAISVQYTFFILEPFLSVDFT
ncbi:hypothetical protein K370107A2_08330 [Merdimmobilis hominis]